MTLIENWKEAWRFFSIHAMAWGAALQVTWVSLTPEMRDSLPPHVVQWVTLALMVFGILGRVIKQTEQIDVTPNQ